MKLTRITIEAFQGLRQVDLAITAPVLFVAGHNHAGKSSLIDAIRMGLTGQPSRVGLKKEYPQLVADGSKKGRISIEADGELVGDIALPAGEWIEALPATVTVPLLSHVLDAQHFAASSPDERRTFLFGLTGCRATPELVRQRLLDRNADPKRVEAVLPLLRSGFPAAAEDAANRAKDAKGAWRGVTGETYGEKKAADWQAAGVEAPTQEAIEEAGQALQAHDAALEHKQISLGVLSERAETAERNTASIALLEEKAGKAQRIRDKLAADEKELEHWTAKVQEIEEAKIAAAGMPCPCCAARLVVQNGALVEVQRNQAADLSKLADYTKARDSFTRAVANDKRDLEDAEGAAARIQDLKAAMPKEIPTKEQLAGLRNEITAALNKRRELAERKNLLVQQRADAEAAASKTAAAAAHHADVLGWLLIADALKPEGIPSELLQEAIAPVNDLLLELCKFAGWKHVAIGADMEITADRRPYRLLSESEKWRADAVLAIAIAKLSGVKLVVLDRFDVLDIESRPQLLDLLDWCVTGGAIESAVIAGTMKNLPSAEALGELYQGVWLDEGRVLPDSTTSTTTEAAA